MRKKVNDLILLNEWLLIFHGVDLEEVKKLHPKWVKAEREYAQINSYPQDKRDEISENMNKASREFYTEYSVTNEEYNEWEEWAKKYIKKTLRVSNRMIEHDFPWIALQIGPTIKKEELI